MIQAISELADCLLVSDLPKLVLVAGPNSNYINTGNMVSMQLQVIFSFAT